MRLADLLLAKREITPELRQEIDNALSSGGPSPRVCSLLRGLSNPETEEACENIERTRQEFASKPEALAAFHDALSGEAILFVGAGLSLGGKKSFSGKDLRDSLVKDLLRTDPGPLKGEDFEPLALQDVAQVYSRRRGETKLTAMLANYCRKHLPEECLDDHHLLAKLNCFRFIFTTNWDRLLELGFAGHEHHVVRTSADVTRLRYDVPNIIKLHGDFDSNARKPDFASPPRVSTEQIAGLEAEAPALHSLMRTLFLAHPVIVLGFRPDDYNFAHALRYAALSLGGAAPKVYVVSPRSAAHHLLTWGEVTHIPGKALDFLDGLEGFIGCAGGTEGRWHSDPGRPLGAIETHGSDECAKSKELGELLGTVNRIELSTGPEDGSAKERVGRLASNLLRQIVRPRDRVVFSCGSTLEALAEEANGSWVNFRDVRLYSASVPITDECSSSTPISLAALFAKRLASLGVSYRSYQLPLAYLGLVADRDFEPYMEIGELKFSVNDECRRVIDSYLEEAGESRVFVLGIGATREAANSGLRRYLESCLRSDPTYNPKMGTRLAQYIEAIEKDEHLKYIGDLMYWLFKPIPRTMPPEEAIRAYFINRDRLLTCLRESNASRAFKEFLARSYCQVRSVPLMSIATASQDEGREVVVVAAGRDKAEAVVSVCRAQLVNTLVIDEGLCDGMLDYLRG